MTFEKQKTFLWLRRRRTERKILEEEKEKKTEKRKEKKEKKYRLPSFHAFFWVVISGD